jgi:hypothetical protein
MIDTDKYEGHTPVRKEWPSWCEDWLFSVYSGKTEDGSHTPTWNQDNALACDAPLLLAEVKRLRDLHILACDYLQSISNGTLPDSEWPHIHAMIRGEEE